MRKWIIAAAIVILLAVGLLVALLNVNSYIARNKVYLINQAEQALGRKLSVADASVSLWNGIGFRLTNFTMADDPAFSSAEFVRAKDLQVNVKFLPLLRKDVQVKKMILHDPVISIIRNQKGDYNFSTIGKKDKEKKPEAARKNRSASGSEDKDGSSAFLVSLVDIAGGELHYRDQKEGTNLLLRQIDLEVEDLDFNKPFTIDLAAALLSSTQNLKVKATLGPFSSADFHDVPVDGEVNIHAVDMEQLQAAVPKLKTRLPKNLDLAGVFRIESLKLKGTLKNLALKGNIVGSDGSIRFGDSFQKARGIPLTISTDAQYGGTRVVLRQAEVKLHNLEVASKGDITLGDRPALNLSIDSKPASLDGWEKIIPAIASYQLSGKMQVRGIVRGEVGKGTMPQIQGTATLENASAKPPQFSKAIENLNTKINFTGQRADIKEMTLILANSKIRLAAAVERFSPLTLTYKLSTPELHPADFQASLPEERKKDLLRNLSSEGQIAIRDGKAAVQAKLFSTDGSLYKINYSELQATLSLADKVASIRNLRVNALKGALQVEGEYAFNGPVPRFSIASRVQELDVKEIYDTFGTKAESDGQRDIRGRLNAEMKVAGSGNQWEEVKPTLRGQGHAQVLQGALLNFNIADSVLSGATGIPGMMNMINPALRKKYPETFESKDTKFKDLKANFDLTDGRINVRNLLIAAVDFSVEGSGWADFDRKVDFRSVLLLSPPLSSDIASSAREIKYLFNDQRQLEIPFALTGKLPQVKPKPDTSYLAKSMQRGFLQRGTEELQQRFLGRKESASPRDEPSPTNRKERKKESTEDLIRKGLKDLFGR
ncbi:MAG TPA: AsmA-like C-terminal region-containing protein [Candidatus Udaeobacter sp.]|nr:AsmA-like C-terminal region-containing protein [Candidatus Udaeobacter sp.]